jgi:hypothetical protein
MRRLAAPGRLVANSRFLKRDRHCRLQLAAIPGARALHSRRAAWGGGAIAIGPSFQSNSLIDRAAIRTQPAGPPFQLPHRIACRLAPRALSPRIAPGKCARQRPGPSCRCRCS